MCCHSVSGFTSSTLPRDPQPFPMIPHFLQPFYHPFASFPFLLLILELSEMDPPTPLHSAPCPHIPESQFPKGLNSVAVLPVASLGAGVQELLKYVWKEERMPETLYLSPSNRSHPAASQRLKVY